MSTTLCLLLLASLMLSNTNAKRWSQEQSQTLEDSQRNNRDFSPSGGKGVVPSTKEHDTYNTKASTGSRFKPDDKYATNTGYSLAGEAMGYDGTSGRHNIVQPSTGDSTGTGHKPDDEEFNGYSVTVTNLVSSYGKDTLSGATDELNNYKSSTGTGFSRPLRAQKP